MKKITKALLFTFLLSVILFKSPTFASAANYPGTSTKIEPGDMLYSTKSESTYFVGHIGIVGTDLNVKHTLLNKPPGISQSVSSYFNRFADITLIKSKKASAAQKKSAATWATNNVGNIKTYIFNSNLSNVSSNYCSKFVWQAYNSTSVDIATTKTMELVGTDLRVWVLPSQIYNDSNNTKTKLK